MGISTLGDSSSPEESPTDSPQSDGDPHGRSVTVPFSVTVELASDSATTLRKAHSTPLGAGPVDATVVADERGSALFASEGPSDPDSGARSANLGAHGWAAPSPRVNPVDRARGAFANFSLSRFTPRL